MDAFAKALPPPHTSLVTVPCWLGRGWSEEDHAEIRKLNEALESLKKHLENFQHAVTLFQWVYSIDRRTSSAAHWSWIAARQGAMSLFHYQKVLEGLPLAKSKEVSLLSRVDISAIRAIRKDFRKQFPNVDEVRNFISHQGESELKKEYASPEAVENSNLSIIGRGFHFSGESLVNFKYIIVWKEIIFEYELDSNSLNYLSDFTLGVFQACRAIGPTTDDILAMLRAAAP